MSATPRQQAADEPRHWTVAEYLQLGDDHPRCELLEGDLVMAPAPTNAHQNTVLCLAAALLEHVRAHQLGRCAIAPLDVVLDEDTVVQPDIVYVAADRLAALDDGHGLTGAPDLVVEVLSPSTERLDRTVKRALYQRAGVAWLVLVAPATQVVEVFRLDAARGQYLLEGTAAGDETLQLGLFPGLELRLAELWLSSPA